MRELSQILAMFDELCTSDMPGAVATVVAVEGSSYRKPGARMLVTAGGRYSGGVSGGCLERDVARRARGVIDHGQPVLCRYETGGNLDALEDNGYATIHGEPGAALGCGGAIEILIQRVTATAPGPMSLLRQAVRDRRAGVMLTVFNVGGSVTGRAVGEVVSTDTSPSANRLLDDALAADLREGASLGRRAEARRHVLSGGWIDVLVEHLRPPRPLIIFGEGSDVVPLTEAAHALGWHVTVVGTRSPAGLRQQFTAADVIIASTAQFPVPGIVTPDAAVVVMTHNLRRDAVILQSIAAAAAGLCWRARAAAPHIRISQLLICAGTHLRNGSTPRSGLTSAPTLPSQSPSPSWRKYKPLFLAGTADRFGTGVGGSRCMAVLWNVRGCDDD